MTFTRITRALLRKAKRLHSQALLQSVRKTEGEAMVALETHMAAVQVAQRCWQQRLVARETADAVASAAEQEIKSLHPIA